MRFKELRLAADFPHASYIQIRRVFLLAVRPVILNGIDHLAERADLAERSVILNLPHIGNAARRD